MRGRVSTRSGRLSVRFLFAAATIAAVAAPASAQTTVTINQPTSQVVHATLRGGTYANTNFNNLLETRASSDLTYERRAMLKFDTQNTIPTGAAVTSATLTVTVKGADTGLTRHIAAYQVTNSFTETETTWNVRRSAEKWLTAGGDIATKLSTQTVSDVVGSKVTFDVTSLVKAAVAGQLGSSRYTRVLLVDVDAPTSLSWRSYYTATESTSALRPTLKVTYGGSAPAPTSTSSSGTTLRVLEYNVQHGGTGTDGVYNPDRAASWVAKINPDVVSIVELESKDSYDSGDGVAQWKAMLEAKTGKTWYSLDIQDYGDWTSGGIRNAIFSKYPISASYRHEFSTGRDRTVGGVSIAVNGRNINFMSTHFDPYDESNRISEAKQLVSYANGFAEDRIILGDFNALPGTTEMNTIGAAYHDAWWDAVAAGTQISASDNPNGYTRRARIDFVWYSKGEAHLTLKSVQVVDTRASNGVMPSDHRPLLATFTVK
ncbi:MAG TPA: DNRLRE domain-containing protein [Vicinamibacterales bacterium]|jgi:endonuclease/exonuclease/phosphatase family metal-dependent hydrolase